MPLSIYQISIPTFLRRLAIAGESFITYYGDSALN
jgi:hypothetical protein